MPYRTTRPEVPEGQLEPETRGRGELRRVQLAGEGSFGIQDILCYPATHHGRDQTAQLQDHLVEALPAEAGERRGLSPSGCASAARQLYERSLTVVQLLPF